MTFEDYEARARVMRALASPVRLMIVEALRGGERCICELYPLLPKEKSTLSRHVAALRHAGIVRERRDGVRVFLSLATPCILDVFGCVMKVIQGEAARHARLAGATAGRRRR